MPITRQHIPNRPCCPFCGRPMTANGFGPINKLTGKPGRKRWRCLRDGTTMQTEIVETMVEPMKPDEIKAIRTAYGENWEQFAARIGCGSVSVRNWEAGRSKPIHSFLKRLRALAQQKGLEVV